MERVNERPDLYQEGADGKVLQDEVIATVRRTVRLYKNHPAVLCWMVGNEVSSSRIFGCYCGRCCCSCRSCCCCCCWWWQ